MAAESLAAAVPMAVMTFSQSPDFKHLSHWQSAAAAGRRGHRCWQLRVAESGAGRSDSDPASADPGRRPPEPRPYYRCPV